MRTICRVLIVIVMSLFYLSSWSQVRIKVKPAGSSSNIALWEYNIEKAKTGGILNKEGSMLKFDDAIFTGYIRDLGIIEYKNKTYLVTLSDITSNDPEFQSYIEESKKELNRMEVDKLQKLREELKAVLFSTVQLMSKDAQLIDGNVYVKTKTSILAKSILDDSSRIINPGDSVYLVCYANDTVHFEKAGKSYYAFARNFDSEITNEIQSKADIAYKRKLEIQKIADAEQAKKDAISLARYKEKQEELKRIKNEEQENLYKSYEVKFGIECAEAIRNKKVYIGMPAEAARLSWGKPKDVNTTTTAYGSKEQWVYSLKSYLYVEKGKITAIQN